MAEEESPSLSAILGDTPVKTFFRDIYQRSCAIFQKNETSSTTIPSAHSFLVSHGFSNLVGLMQECERAETLYFRLQEQVEKDHHLNAFSAYLDGCSVVVNHADKVLPTIADLCDDLQLSFPHVYANAYITPPSSQAVRPHADDRDVWIFQIYGSKTWKVYKKVPVPYPFAHEQVGKDGIHVPEEVLTEVLICHTLRAGQVLYMPRGYVHEATSEPEDCSFHVTVAIATHDWCLASIITDMTRSVLSRNIAYRRAIPRELGTSRVVTHELEQSFEEDLEKALQEVQENISAQNVCQFMAEKYRKHNMRAARLREELKKAEPAKPSLFPPVGKEAAESVHLSSTIRLATEEERSYIPASSPKGMYVREENAQAILDILERFRCEPGLVCEVGDLPGLTSSNNTSFLCPLTLLSFSRVCVEQGALAVVAPPTGHR